MAALSRLARRDPKVSRPRIDPREREEEAMSRSVNLEGEPVEADAIDAGSDKAEHTLRVHVTLGFTLDEVRFPDGTFGYFVVDGKTSAWGYGATASDAARLCFRRAARSPR
jgi:hypothetical protein